MTSRPGRPGETTSWSSPPAPLTVTAKEQTYPATFSALLLFGAGGLALLNGLVRTTDRSEQRGWFLLALIFTFLGIDESTALHEILQDRVHLWGQAVLMPVVLVGVATWWITLERLRPQVTAARLFFLGGASWVLSQAIDFALNEPWGWTVVPEELLEMAGSALFGLALLVALHALVDVPGHTGSPASGSAERLRGVRLGTTIARWPPGSGCRARTPRGCAWTARPT